MSKRKAVGGSEQDAFSPGRPLLHWQRGELRKLKRKANKRERGQAKERAMTERYTPEWGAEPDHIKEWKRSRPTPVDIHPADSEEGRDQVEAVARSIYIAHGGTEHGWDYGFAWIAGYREMARAALDALRAGTSRKTSTGRRAVSRPAP